MEYFIMKKKRILLLLLLSILVIVIYNIILNNMVEVVHTNVEIESLPEEFQDFKILQLTDLHNKIFMNDQKYLIDKINSIDYDILVITGDMSDYNDIEKSDGFIKLLDGINNKNNINIFHFVIEILFNGMNLSRKNQKNTSFLNRVFFQIYGNQSAAFFDVDNFRFIMPVGRHPLKI